MKKTFATSDSPQKELPQTENPLTINTSVTPPPSLIVSGASFSTESEVTDRLRTDLNNFLELTNHTSRQRISFNDLTEISESVDIEGNIFAENISSPLSQEIDKFLQDCNGGELERRGLVANFKRNNFLKKGGLASNSSTSTVSSLIKASTQDAFVMEIDREELSKRGSADDIATINALTGYREEVYSFRTKKIKYGNPNALQEVLSQKLYAMTGLTSPDTRLQINEDHLRPDGTPEVSVASPMITGYYDLGNFFVDDAIRRFIAPKSHELWRDKKEQIEAINYQDIITKEDKIKRIELMGEIYELLPNYFHNEIEKSFAASKFIANWDFANFDLNNIGCKFTLNDQGQIIGLKSVFVDFGNSGIIGFGGKYKEQSLARANTEAKAKLNKPDDYDPPLVLTKAEELLIAETNHILEEERKKHLNVGAETAVGRLAENLKDGLVTEEKKKILIRSILFKTSHHISAGESTMEINNDDLNRESSGFLTFSDLPRNIPFAFLLKPALRKKTAAVSAALEEKFYQAVDSSFAESTDNLTAQSEKLKAALQDSTKLNLQNSIYLDSEIEMAFRLSLIPDEAIDHVTKKWNLGEEYPNIFPLPDNLADPEKYSSAGLAKIFRDRKNTLIQLIPEEIINDWVANNKAEALAAEQSVRIAVLEETDSIFEIQVGNSFALRVADNLPINTDDRTTQLASEIKRQIKQDQKRSVTIRPETLKEFADESNILDQNINAKVALEESLKSLHNIPESLQAMIKKDLDVKAETISHLTAKTKKLETEVEQQMRQSTVNFIKNNAEEWKQQMAVSNLSCCDLFDLSKIKRIYELRHRTSHGQFGRDGEIGIEADRLAENKIIDSRNKFTHREFVKILDTLSPALQSDLSFSPTRASVNKVSAHKHLINK